ncbi:Antiholin-like protein LrgA [Paramagnetospirillum magnetotacticum MS-1]|uniref:Antiholin-like protein LrgA n=1 Tax=Paramagnetospirillum magnetotacticum MS-1 TaxID=272627 RepID=A0A0C2YXV9_PARME|nr:CidA/LrgA family protein [Paramagnetospirillum magnetotacticum]KIL99943.1 Antiholin-like protein LrgA [Paramagnetospirillum magnetotacticum MS-1]
MLPYITVLLLCQLAGEVLVRLSGWPLPGPVVGMVLLFTGLVIRGRIPSGLDLAVKAILSNFALLFIPASVGVMVHLKLIAEEALPIAAAVLGSTFATIVVSGLLMQALTKRPKTGGEP